MKRPKPGELYDSEMYGRFLVETVTPEGVTIRAEWFEVPSVDEEDEEEQPAARAAATAAPR